MGSEHEAALASGALLLAALALGGCSSTSIADLWSARRRMLLRAPKDPGGYLPVHDLPPDRDEPELAPAERAKIEAELAAARDRQASRRRRPKRGPEIRFGWRERASVLKGPQFNRKSGQRR